MPQGLARYNGWIQILFLWILKISDLGIPRPANFGEKRNLMACRKFAGDMNPSFSISDSFYMAHIICGV